MVEIGVRTGYSGWALCLGADTAPSYVGIDSLEGLHGGTRDRSAWAHAESIIREVASPVRMVAASSHDLARLDQADLYHVDGDHSTGGAGRHQALLGLVQRAIGRTGG